MLRGWLASRLSATPPPKFQRAPTLGGECYLFFFFHPLVGKRSERFQRAPTLGGECYCVVCVVRPAGFSIVFQRAPTLGGECYGKNAEQLIALLDSFNGHPPLGVNATGSELVLEGKCFSVSTGTHPWG